MPFRPRKSFGGTFDDRIALIEKEMTRRGYPVKVISRRRTKDQQQKLYKQGRSSPGSIVTELSGEPGRESKHQTGDAVDFNFVGKSQWDILGEVAKEYGLEWGGDWKSLVDKPHVQNPTQRFAPRGISARGITNPDSTNIPIKEEKLKKSNRATSFPTELPSRRISNQGTLANSSQPQHLGVKNKEEDQKSIDSTGLFSNIPSIRSSPIGSLANSNSQMPNTQAIYPITDRRTGKKYRMSWDGPGKPDRESVRKFIYEQENRSVFQKVKTKASESLEDIGEGAKDFVSKPGVKSFLFGPGALSDKERIDRGERVNPKTGKPHKIITPGFGEEQSLLPTLKHDEKEGWPKYLAKGAYNTLVQPLGTGSGMLGMSVPSRLKLGTPKPPQTKGQLRLGSGKTTEPSSSIIDADFRELPDIELPPGPSPTQLSATSPQKALPPGKPPFYSGRRGTSQNLEDVGEFVGHGDRAAGPYGTIGSIPNRFESTRGPGINLTGPGLEDFPISKAPVSKPPVAKAPPTDFLSKMSDSDLASLAELGDDSAIAAAKSRPGLRDRLKHLFKDEGGFAGEKRPEGVGVPRGGDRRKTEKPITFAERRISERRQAELQQRFGGTKKEPEARDTVISKLNKLLTDEKGFVKLPSSQARKDFREIYDDLATSGLTVIKNLGGEDLERLILRNRLDGEQLAGRINSKLKTITKDLTQEELTNYINVRDVGARPLNQKVADAFSKYKDVDHDVTRMAKMVGMGIKRGKKIVPFEGLGKEGEYFSHIYPPEWFKDKPKALKAIMDDGYTLEQAERILKRATEYGERLIDPQHGRVVNAPGYRKDINVDYQHINDITRRIKQAHDFGPLDTADANSPISRMIAATDDPIRVGKIVKRYLGREEPMNPAWARGNNAIIKFQTATKLSKFLINNTAQLGMIPVRAGFKNTGKALAQTLFDYKGAKSIAEQTGAHQPILNELVKEVGGPKGVARWFGISKGEEINRTIAAIAGRHTAKDLFKKLQKNPTKKRARKQLADLILENPDDLLKQGKLTDWQINRAGARMSEVTQGRASNIDLPRIWTDVPAARLVFLYKRYAFQQSKNIKKAFEIMGPVRSAAIITGTATILGEGIGDVNAILKGVGRSVGGGGDVGKEIAQAIKDRGEGYERIVNNLAQAWALGYVGDVLESAGRGSGGITSNVAGPIIGDIDEAGTNLANLDARGLAAMGARMVPLFGTGLASAIRESRRPRGRGRRRSRR